MTTERGRTVKALMEEHRRRKAAVGKRKTKPSFKVEGLNSLSNMMRQDGIRLKDIRRGAGLAPTA
jgi:hypothetical protein